VGNWGFGIWLGSLRGRVDAGWDEAGKSGMGVVRRKGDGGAVPLREMDLATAMIERKPAPSRT